jgi:hypothetical protein
MHAVNSGCFPPIVCMVHIISVEDCLVSKMRRHNLVIHKWKLNHPVSGCRIGWTVGLPQRLMFLHKWMHTMLYTRWYIFLTTGTWTCNYGLLQVLPCLPHSFGLWCWIYTYNERAKLSSWFEDLIFFSTKLCIISLIRSSLHPWCPFVS